jgi:site-specific DNA-methyltransferase (cytosine-N4-specific)
VNPTRTPAYTDARTTLFTGDARTVLTELPAASVDCIVTSPPYYRLRDYHVAGQYGLESTLDSYLENLRATFAEAHRVLKSTGTFWLNIGDSYATHASGRRTSSGLRGRPNHVTTPAGFGAKTDLPAKSLMGVPWRLALALQADGWVLRNAVIWHKPNAMPQSCRDRLSTRYEHVFLFVKSRHYHFDLDAIRQPHAPASHARAARGHAGEPARARLSHAQNGIGRPHTLHPDRFCHPSGANPGDVWSISTRPSRTPHYATYPIDLPLRAIAAGSPEGGTVCDPFSGTATTGLAAHQLGRRYIGVELNPDYQATAKARLSNQPTDPATSKPQHQHHPTHTGQPD